MKVDSCFEDQESLTFMEPAGPLPCSLQFAIGPYPEPLQPIQNSHTLFP